MQTLNRSVSSPHVETMDPSIPRVCDAICPGDNVPQGDVNMVCIAALPKSAKTRASRQIADGDTRGSRHVVEGGAVYDADAVELAQAVKQATGLTIDPQYMGPVVEGLCVLTHPQHQHHKYPAGVVMVAVYQRNLNAEEREIRASD
jgi:hypothetical protein